MEFNQQLAIGKHAQVVEVECRRSYEGKGAHPDYSKVTYTILINLIQQRGHNLFLWVMIIIIIVYKQSDSKL